MTTIAQPGPALAARVVANEAAKGLQLMWRRRATVIAFVIMNALYFLGIRLLVGGGHVVTPLLAATLPALLALAVAQTAALQGSAGIAEEINGGTLGQTHLGAASPQLQVLGRLVALGIEGLAAAALLGLGFVLGFGVHYTLRPDALVPAALTVADGLGYGLLIIALTVRIVSIGAITHVFGMVIQFLGGMLVPVTVFPHAVETFARFLPTTLGVQALNATLAGRPLWADGTLGWLLAHAAASLALGWGIYTRNIRRTRREAGV